METKIDTKEIESTRLSTLSRTHRLTYNRAGQTYIFDTFEARSLRQALAFAEGYDYAIAKLESKTSHDDPTTQLAITSQYKIKRLWIGLAAFFGVVGCILYAFGIRDLGSASASGHGVRVTLENVGPGLIVMVFALAASVVGAARTKLKLTRIIGKAEETIELGEGTNPTPGPGPLPIETANAARECKLFNSLLQHLINQTSAYVILNSSSQIDIKSMGWSVPPVEIWENAISAVATWKAAIKIKRSAPGPGWSKEVGDWTMKVIPFEVTDDNGDSKLFCVVSLSTSDMRLEHLIVREETRPTFCS